jgi:hypothetical protein
MGEFFVKPLATGHYKLFQRTLRMKNCTRALVLTLLCASVSHEAKPLTETAATGYSIAGGVAIAALVGGIIYYNTDDDLGTEAAKLKKFLIAAAVGAGVGGLTGLTLYYCWLSNLTPSGRLAAAQLLINEVNRNGIVNADDLFAYVAGRYNIRWPLALAHEDCIRLLNKLDRARLKLNLAMPDVQDDQVRDEIQRLLPTVAPLINNVQRQARALQRHRQYEVQAVLLEGNRREQRMEQEAAQRHREAMAAQERRHQEAMRQQERLLRPHQ